MPSREVHDVSPAPSPRVRLGEGVLARIDRLFAPDERADAAALLAERCGERLPGTDGWPPHAIERIQVAALKLSGGDFAALSEAVRIANVDWRDVLVAAGFGHDTRAHESWWPGASQ
jgi:hypothetical protein